MVLRIQVQDGDHVRCVSRQVFLALVLLVMERMYGIFLGGSGVSVQQRFDPYRNGPIEPHDSLETRLLDLFLRLQFEGIMVGEAKHYHVL
jgi:hypothetical protein